MAASYPAGFDTMSDNSANLSGPPLHSTMHNQINLVIEAIEAELGLNPSGADATVAATIAALPSRYAPLSQGQRVGYVAYAVNQTGIGAADTGMTGLGLNFTAVAGRRYEMRYTFCVTQVTAGGVATFQWTLAAVASGIIDISDGVSGATRMVTGFVDLGVLTAGVKTIGLLARTNGGTLTIQSGSFSPGRLSIIDVGT